jgi:hypothetical protein
MCGGMKVKGYGGVRKCNLKNWFVDIFVVWGSGIFGKGGYFLDLNGGGEIWCVGMVMKN